MDYVTIIKVLLKRLVEVLIEINTCAHKWLRITIKALFDVTVIYFHSVMVVDIDGVKNITRSYCLPTRFVSSRIYAFNSM